MACSIDYTVHAVSLQQYDGDYDSWRRGMWALNWCI